MFRHELTRRLLVAIAAASATSVAACGGQVGDTDEALTSTGGTAGSGGRQDAEGGAAGQSGGAGGESGSATAVGAGGTGGGAAGTGTGGAAGIGAGGAAGHGAGGATVSQGGAVGCGTPGSGVAGSGGAGWDPGPTNPTVCGLFEGFCPWPYTEGLAEHLGLDPTVGCGGEQAVFLLSVNVADSCGSVWSCCYRTDTLLCGGRPLLLDDGARVARLVRGGRWTV
jgi:hypothetical protein